MYIDENDVRTPRERACDDVLRRMAHEQSRNATAVARPSCACPVEPRAGKRDCRGEYVQGGPSLAMVYSPYQHWQNVYDHDKGFSRGTIFRDLDMPFEASQSKGGCC